MEIAVLTLLDKAAKKVHPKTALKPLENESFVFTHEK